jgi:uncharacterized membrane protein YkgB
LISKISSRRTLYCCVSRQPLGVCQIDALFAAAQRIAAPLLRISLGIIVLWIGALKFVDPSPVVMLLKASLPFLAFDGFVYAVGVVEVIAAPALIFGIGVRYVGLAVLGLFTGTLTIFVISPMVTGFPFLNLTGQSLLKDFVLFAVTLMMIAVDSSKYSKVRATSKQGK